MDQLFKKQKTRAKIITKRAFMIKVAVLFFMLPGVATAGWHQLGVHFGICSYDDTIGDTYTEETRTMGLGYELFFGPLLSLYTDYSQIATLTDSVSFRDPAGVVVETINTEIRGALYTLTPTFNLRLEPSQPFIPKIGIGISYLQGQQKFEESQYLQSTSNHFTGLGFNITGGLSIYLYRYFGISISARQHYINLEIKKGLEGSQTDTNKILEYYGGFFIKFGSRLEDSGNQ